VDTSEIGEFLNRSPATTGFVAVSLPDGGPLVLPVWYRFDGSTVNIWTTTARRWPQAVLRTGRAAFAAGDAGEPFAAVVLRGRAEVTEGDDPAIYEEVRAITRRYIPPDEVDAYVAQWWPDLKAVVRIHPDAVRGWDRGY
jgi:Pyridoxamine 5'-phosphate oxidase